MTEWSESIKAAAASTSYEDYLNKMAEAEARLVRLLRLFDRGLVADAAEHADQAANNDWCE